MERSGKVGEFFCIREAGHPEIMNFRISVFFINFTSGVITQREHLPQTSKTPRFGHGDVVFYLFIETGFLHLFALLSNFSKVF